MKSISFLFAALVLSSLVFFTACQKEELNHPADAKVSQTLSVENRVATSFTIWYFGNYPHCLHSTNTLCEIGFPTYSNTPGLNGASGTVYVDEAQDLILDFDQVNFDEQLEEEILNNQVLTVETPVTFPQETITKVYEEAGYEVPTASFGLSAGVYPVELEEIDETAPTARRIKRKIIRYNRDGTIRKIKYKYYRN